MLPWKPAVEYTLLILLSIYLLFYGIIPSWKSIHSDFPSYYVSSRIVLEGTSVEKLYNDDYFSEKAREYGIDRHVRFSPFPPATAFILLPLASLDPLAAQRIWTLVNIIALGACIYILKKITCWRYRPTAVFVLLGGIGLATNFRFGQFYLMLSLMIMTAYLLEKNGKLGWAGLLLGLGMVLKYFPMVFVLGYVISKSWKLVFYSVGTVFFLIALQAVVFGPDLLQHYFNQVFWPHLEGKIGGQGAYSYLYQSWESLFNFLFVYHPDLNPNPLINWPVGKAIAKFLVHSMVLTSMVWIIWKIRANKLVGEKDIYLYLVGLAALVLLPASASYHFLLLTFPMALMIKVAAPDTQTLRLGMLVVPYVLIGFIPYGYLFAMGKEWVVVLAYPRLLLVSIIYIFSLIFTWQYIVKINPE